MDKFIAKSVQRTDRFPKPIILGIRIERGSKREFLGKCGFEALEAIGSRKIVRQKLVEKPLDQKMAF
ncbi:MAG: hypothetical protein DMD54_03445 [Gemmatimonadetes bacterium]|nr:MAG: hypothetical protein DMD54_03445 [Gemmatimonadota bacterium]